MYTWMNTHACMHTENNQVYFCTSFVTLWKGPFSLSYTTTDFKKCLDWQYIMNTVTTKRQNDLTLGNMQVSTES